tara:strand:- start:66 stop:266 length:201 start_codon:yes stop_codon:yes gene_type:complete
MYTLTILDLQGGGMGANGVHAQFPTLAETQHALNTWIDEVGKHLPIQYSGYKYSWFIKDPQGKEII